MSVVMFMMRSWVMKTMGWHLEHVGPMCLKIGNALTAASVNLILICWKSDPTNKLLNQSSYIDVLLSPRRFCR